MSGHSKWHQIKHKKAATDEKRGKLFSKLLKAISVAAREEPNPEANPRLRKLVEKAREFQVPNENIERAIKKSKDKLLEEIIVEAYGPGGVALIAEGITDNRLRTFTEIKQILKEHEGKWAEPGSVEWAFEIRRENGEKTYEAKFPLRIEKETRQKVQRLIDALKNHDDIEHVWTSSA